MGFLGDRDIQRASADFDAGRLPADGEVPVISFFQPGGSAGAPATPTLARLAR